ncbi:MAG: transposase [Candidatus Aminicenantes bacterium]|nr:MAG: transposase [Candidatus Aminicenantes bacterium]
MARPLRIQYEGAFYHITARGNEKKDIFTNDADRNKFIEILESVAEKYRWIVHAYCLMSNHYHLVVETPLKNLSAGMRQLNGVYTQSFNKKHGRIGHLFQGRFKAYLIEKENYLLEACRYIVLNPVRAGIVHDPLEWEYSSCRKTFGDRKRYIYLYPDLILSFFSNSLADAQKGYIKYVKEGIGKESPFNEAHGGFILGGEKFVKSVMEKNKIIDCEEIAKREKYVSRLNLRDIFAGKERDEGIAIAINRWRYSLEDVGKFVRLHYSCVSRIAKKAKNNT